MKIKFVVRDPVFIVFQLKYDLKANPSPAKILSLIFSKKGLMKPFS
jgi:hypothetical protein